MKSRRIDLRSLERSDAVNRMTVAVGLEPLRIDYRSLFVDNYQAVLAKRECLDESGVLVMAVDTISGAAAGSMWLAAKPGTINSAVVGRHSACDLFLPEDSTLSLRHLALVVEPLQSYDRPPSFHVLDLKTRDGFFDENENALRGIVVEGPAFIRVGRYAMYFLSTGDVTDYPEDGETAWSLFPERIYLHERFAEGTSRRAIAPNAGLAVPLSAGPRHTLIHTTLGPHSVHRDLLEDGEDVLGTLRVRTHAARETYSVGLRALRDGLLIGRYARCETSRLLSDRRISRVHLLVIAVDDRLWAIDVASTLGTWRLARRHGGLLVESAVTELSGETRLILSSRVAEIRWRGDLMPEL